jgi:peptide/nickel transport system permease protein
MVNFIIRRLAVTTALLFVISLISFFMVTLTPGSPYPWGELNPKISAEVKANFRKKFHLDQPLPTQYALIMRDLFTGNLRSIKDDRPVISRFIERLPATLALNFSSILIALSFGTLLGVIAARHAGSWQDVGGSFTAIFFIALPGFWLSYLVAIVLVKEFGVPILGTQSYGIDFPNALASGLDRIWHLLVPATILAIGGIAVQSRYLRATMIESLREDYIRTARAKGLPEDVVLYKHALRNSIRPIIAGIGMLLPAMISGSVVIETIFAYPGIGRLSYEAILERDYPTIVAMNFFVAALILIGNLISDLLYAFVDPRVRLE